MYMAYAGDGYHLRVSNVVCQVDFPGLHSLSNTILTLLNYHLGPTVTPHANMQIRFNYPRLLAPYFS